MNHKLKSIQIDGKFEKLIQERLTNSIEKCSDKYIFECLCLSIFAGGYNYTNLSNLWDEITNEFNGFNVIDVGNFRKLTVGEFLDRFQSLRNYGKIIACIQNAETFIKIQSENGDFKSYIKNFGELEDLVNDLTTNFSYLGPITVYDFLREIGYNSAKPDVHLRRIMYRLGFLENDKDNHTNRSKIHETSEKIAGAIGTNVPVVDAVFWLYGSGSTKYVQHGICTNNPKCHECELETMCENPPT